MNNNKKSWVFFCEFAQERDALIFCAAPTVLENEVQIFFKLPSQKAFDRFFVRVRACVRHRSIFGIREE